MVLEGGFKAASIDFPCASRRVTASLQPAEELKNTPQPSVSLVR